jgi:poly-gamma-glutamate synthesis protein (capsule biosynthesis protein)
MDRIKIGFGGDLAIERRYSLLANRSQELLFGDLLEPMRDCDFTVANLETPVTSMRHGIFKDGPVIRSDHKSLKFLSRAGISALSLANNHSFDFGIQGLLETRKICNTAGLATFGGGIDRSEIDQPLFFEKNNRKVIIIGAAEHEFNSFGSLEYGVRVFDAIDIARQVTSLKSEHMGAAVVVFLHAGNELISLPPPWLRKAARFLIEIGADAVVGHHPHVVGAYEIYKDRPIFYSLGNLIYDRYQACHLGWDIGMFLVLEFCFDGNDIVVNSSPFLFKQDPSLGVTDVQDFERSRAKKEILEAAESLSKPDYEAHWRCVVSNRFPSYMGWTFSPLGFRGLGFITRLRFVSNMFFNRSSAAIKLNYVRSPSHRDVLLAAMEQQVLRSSKRFPFHS